MEEGPGARCLAMPFGEVAVTKDRGGARLPEREERGERGWAAAAALRGGRRLGRPVGWPGCLPRWFSFLKKTFFFSFSCFSRIRKRKVFGGDFFMELIFNKITISESSTCHLLVLKISKV